MSGVWQIGADESHTAHNEASGMVNVLAMMQWMEQHGYLPQHSTLYAASFGFEICSTNGTTQTFQVNNFSWAQK